MSHLDEDTVSERLLIEANKLRNDVGAAELIAALDHAGIRSILLKGPSIARWLYAETESRPYGDVDLLVPPQDFERAEGVAAGLGFAHVELEATRADRDTSHHETWFRGADGVRVELHRGFLGVGASDEELWAALAGRTVRMPLQVLGVEADVLSPPARALFVGLHVAVHGQEGKPVEDLRRALSRVPPEIWEDAAALAVELQAEPAFAIGLSALPEGAELARRLGVTGGGASTEVLLRSELPPPTAMGWERLARKSGLRAKLAYVAAELVPPADFLRAVDPLAQRGRAGLIAAYLARPFRLVRRAPRGLHAWQEARGRAHADG